MLKCTFICAYTKYISAVQKVHLNGGGLAIDDFATITLQVKLRYINISPIYLQKPQQRSAYFRV